MRVGTVIWIAIAWGVVISVGVSAEEPAVWFSLDGVVAAPEIVSIQPGETLGMFVISETSGVGYWKDVSATWGLGTAIHDVVVYPEAGDMASVIDLSETGFYAFRLEASDSQGNIEAGTHFGFDITMDSGAAWGDVEYLYLASGVLPDDTVVFNIIPEPGTVGLFSLGGLVAFRRRRSR